MRAPDLNSSGILSVFWNPLVNDGAQLDDRLREVIHCGGEGLDFILRSFQVSLLNLCHLLLDVTKILLELDDYFVGDDLRIAEI